MTVEQGQVRARNTVVVWEINTALNGWGMLGQHGLLKAIYVRPPAQAAYHAITHMTTPFHRLSPNPKPHAILKTTCACPRRRPTTACPW